MLSDKSEFLILEPYYGGSHRAFVRGLQQYLDFSFTLVSLPARKWKMRMQLAAPLFAGQITELYESGKRYDAILTSSLLDVSVLRVLLQQKGILLPLAVYFHENQFVYPERESSGNNFQFALLNFNTALAADTVAFNSHYNKDTFMNGVRQYLEKIKDIDVKYLVETLERKSLVLYPGIDFSSIDNAKKETGDCKCPVVLWNHRWEHDKGPGTFFDVLLNLAAEKVPFKLIVLGESFRNKPEIFSQVEKQLQGNIIHYGYVKSRDEYADLLRKSDVVVSTAKHEFFGMAVMEAVRAGCRPFVPDRLAYRELFPEQYRYQDDTFGEDLRAVLLDHGILMRLEDTAEITRRFSWPEIAPSYRAWLLDLGKDSV